MAGDFNTPFISLDKSIILQINKGTIAINDGLDQMDLINVYRTFHSKRLNLHFISSAHGTFSRIHHMLGHKTIVNKFKKIEIMLSIFSITVL